MKNILFCFVICLCIASPPSQGYAQGAGYALQFDGVDDYVNIPDAPVLNITQQLTVEAWFKTNVIPSSDSKTIVSKDENFEIHVLSSGNILWWSGPFGGSHDIISNSTINTGTWYHVAIVYNLSSGTASIYLNGLMDVQTGTFGNLTTTSLPLQIGADQGYSGREFDGQIDEVRVWNIARSQTQIQQTMNHRLFGNEPGLVGYWRFDEGTGLLAGDSSGHGNTGTLTNGPSWVPSSAPITSVQLLDKLIPNRFSLEQNFPNPFNPSTNISFTLPLKTFVLLKVFNILGEEVATLVNEELPPGTHLHQWNAGAMPSGVYLYRLQAGSFTETKKLILLR